MAKITTYDQDILKVSHEDIPWERLSGCNILITGATGLIGGCLVEALMANPHRDYRVYACGRNEGRAKVRFGKFFGDEDFRFIRYDVQEPLDSDINFDYIVHAASNASPNFFAEKPVEIVKSNILGTFHLLEFGLQHGMKRFLYVSSGEIYGEGDGRMFTEEYSGYVDCINPRSCYPSSKRAAETLCVSYAAEYGADVVIARPCHTYGPHYTESDNRAYAQFIDKVLEGNDIHLNGTGSQVRAWCYVVDCVRALLYIMTKGASGEAYNVSDDTTHLSIFEFAKIIANCCGKNVLLPKKEKTDANEIITKAIFDNSKLKSLGWNITSDVKSKILTTIEERKVLKKTNIGNEKRGNL